MTMDKDSLPLRRTAEGERIETRPLHVEEWLDSLPYVDFQRTSRLLCDATRATNEQVVKPNVRLELVELYHRPYQYYLESQIKTGAQHTLQSIENMQGQLEMLKLIASNLAAACKRSAEELLKRKSLWGQNKPPLQPLLWSMTYLSHALIFSFLEYAPMPRGVWRELNFSYDFAESLKQEHAALKLPGGGGSAGTMSISDAYKRIVMASLADPHHLPFGAVWEIFEQLRSWVAAVKISDFHTVPEAGAHYVVKLDSDARPLPYVKFNTKTAGGRHRLVDAVELGAVVQRHLDAVNTGRGLDAGVKLSPYFAKSVLGHMSRSWGLPPKRGFARQPREGSLGLACGLNAAWFFLNGRKEFIPPASAQPDDDVIVDDPAEPVAPAGEDAYPVDQWDLVETGARGFSVVKKSRPAQPVRVGDLVALGGEGAAAKWRLGMTRWLMVERDRLYKTGIEVLPGPCRPVSVRARTGSAQDCSYRRGFLASNPADPGQECLITSRGLFIGGRELEVSDNGEAFGAVAEALVESSPGFEYFRLRRS